MNLEFSSDQQFIREQARNFLTQECTPDRVRTAMESDDAYDKALWQQIVELGWTAMAIPEEHGGLGLGALELCVIAEELGRVAAPVPFSSSVFIATEAIKGWGSSTQQANYLPRLAAGEIIGAFADCEGLVAAGTSTQFDNGKLTGTKLPVADGDVADFAIVTAVGSDGQAGLYIVDLTTDNVTREALNSMDPSRSQATITFNGAAAEPLGSAGSDALSALLDQAAILIAFEQIGGAHAALDMGMAYTTERYAFGRPVASFQAIKHKFADMYVAVELARSNAYYAASALTNAAEDLPLAAATARVSATDAYYLSSKENIQAHGGMGFTWEFDCHFYYRRAQMLSGVIGTQPHWKELVATRLLQAA
ncbi:MAG: acyl-CoA dehydrogenase family protein [Halioglobus sp.]